MKNALIGTSLRRTLLVAALLLAVMVTIRACSGVRGGWPSFVHTRGQSSQFHDLVSVGDTLRAQQLLAKKPELLESRDLYGRTPIILATNAGRHREALSAWLLARGADVNATDPNGFSALYWAAFYGYRELGDLLIAHGADVNTKTRSGETPVYAAAKNGFTDVVELLANHGADVNAASKEGWTPLHLAARQGDQDMVNALLAHGADVRARDINWSMPVQ